MAELVKWQDKHGLESCIYYSLSPSLQKQGDGSDAEASGLRFWCLTFVSLWVAVQQDVDDLFRQQSAIYKDGMRHSDDDPCSIELVVTQVSETACFWVDTIATGARSEM